MRHSKAEDVLKVLPKSGLILLLFFSFSFSIWSEIIRINDGFTSAHVAYRLQQAEKERKPMMLTMISQPHPPIRRCHRLSGLLGISLAEDGVCVLSLLWAYVQGCGGQCTSMCMSIAHVQVYAHVHPCTLSSTYITCLLGRHLPQKLPCR